MSPYWSYVLTAVGVFGLWLAGRKDWRGWLVGVGAQGLWIAYATATQQWGFYISAVAYGWVYARNLHLWRRERAAKVCADPTCYRFGRVHGPSHYHDVGAP